MDGFPVSVTRIPINEDAWRALTPPAVFVNDAGVYRFIVPGRSEVVNANSEGTDLLLTLDRSSGHRALKAYLGE